LKAEIILEYEAEKIATAIAKAVSPDNFIVPVGLCVKTVVKDKKIITNINCSRTLPTFIATIDDLLFSVSTSEKILQTTKKLECSIT
jgi:hypothetical protein